jgi:nitrogenase-stabilizing/protective protein
MMTGEDFDLELDELLSAEDFLQYFKVDHDPKVVQVNRLHILQRFHDYLADVEDVPADTDGRWALHADLLADAYQDFVASDALTEKVFRDLPFLRAKKPFPGTSLHSDCPQSTPPRLARRSAGP